MSQIERQLTQRLHNGGPPPNHSGADQYKLQRQIARHGTSILGMPPLLAYEGSDGILELVDGVTRATRVAKLLPGTKVRSRSSATCGEQEPETGGLEIPYEKYRIQDKPA